MREPHHRLQEARRTAGFDTASDAARAFGWNENTYRSHENGERGLRPGVVAQYARAFRSSPSWILLGEMPKIEVTAIEREPILIFSKGVVSKKDPEGTTIYIDTSMVFSSLSSRFLLLHEDLFPRHEQYDMLVMTPASLDNNMSKNDFLMEDSGGEFYFGDLLGAEGTTYLKTPNNKLIRTHDSKSLYVVMCIIKRPFYELTDHPPPSTV